LEQLRPHILIEGHIALTQALWDRCGSRKPIVLSANAHVHPVASLFRQGYQDQWGDGLVHRLFGAFMIMGHRRTGKDWINSFGKLQFVLELARDRFKLARDKPVRIVCAGSHESLWAQEQTGHDGLLREHEQKYLAELKRGREYARALYEALSTVEGIELVWAAKAFPQLRPRTRTPLYLEVAGMARQALMDLMDELPAGTAVPAIPRLYTRARTNEPWKAFTGGRWNGRGPYTTTTKLLEQYRNSLVHQQGHECVLTKLLPPDEQWLNPCDCPIVTLEQRKLAAAAGVSAILLDRRFGVIEYDYDRRPRRVPAIYAI
jgi:hypothetical protein